MNKITMLILGMIVVTYLPRLIPFILMGNKKIPKKFEEFLNYIPYAALGALIIPGFSSAIPGNFSSSLAGLLVALLIGFFRGGVILPVIGAILTCMMFLKFGI